MDRRGQQSAPGLAFGFSRTKGAAFGGGVGGGGGGPAGAGRPAVGFGSPRRLGREREEDDDGSDAQLPRRKFPRVGCDGGGGAGSGDDERTFDEDSDDEASNAAATSLPGGGESNAGKDEEEDEDPLEAFMACIEDKVKEDASKEPQQPKIRRDDIEDEDEIESYVNAMKKKGITVGRVNAGGADVRTAADEDANSDEEVYAAAARADAGLKLDSDDEPPKEKRKDVEPLPSVDHDSITYPEIEKNFYEEHPDIAALSDEKVHEIRKQLDMRVSGSDVAKPCISFAHFGFDEALIDIIARCGYTEPTGIQRQAVPVALSGRDIIGIAKTGSGKTAAFLWPMIVHMMDQEPLAPKGDGPIGLILAPTRELGHQIYVEAKRFGKAYGLKTAVVYGGADKMEQFKELRAGNVEILVATPGRLIDMIKMKATNLRRVSFLVLDEADRMFDLGFEPQVRSICDNVRPDRQTLLFSATFPKKVERLARQVTDSPVRIAIGVVGQANEDVSQIVHILPDDSYKWDWLVQRLAGFVVDGGVIVFVSRKDGVDALAENLKSSGFDCAPLHGDIPQFERDRTIRNFRHNKFPILVCTDVAARGLDIKSVKNVVNFDVARDVDAHTHRVGRTGRAGEKGTAHVLLTEKEDRFAAELVKNFEGSGLTITEELMALAMKNAKFRKQRQYREGHGVHRGRGRGRGRGGIGYQPGQGREASRQEFVPQSQGREDPYRQGFGQQQSRHRAGLGHSGWRGPSTATATSSNATPLSANNALTMKFRKAGDLSSTFTGSSLPAPAPIPSRAPMDDSREAQRARAVADGAAKAAILASKFAAQFASSQGTGTGK